MRLFFTIWNVLVEDGNFDDLGIGNKFQEALEVNELQDIKEINNTRTAFYHIKDNLYDVNAYVYRVTRLSIFIEVDGVLLTIDNKKEYQFMNKGSYYMFRAFLNCDIWNWFGLSWSKENEYLFDEIEIEGTIKSLKYKENGYDKFSYYLVELEVTNRVDKSILYEK